jgi:hypothetical protein
MKRVGASGLNRNPSWSTPLVGGLKTFLETLSSALRCHFQLEKFSGRFPTTPKVGRLKLINNFAPESNGYISVNSLIGSNPSEWLQFLNLLSKKQV